MAKQQQILALIKPLGS